MKAGMRPTNAQPVNYDKNKSAWEAFNQANMGKQGMARNAHPTTPRRQGFNPNVPGSDEKPADAHYFHRKFSDDLGRGKPGVNVRPPPSGPPPTSNPSTPVSPVSPKSNRPYPDPTRPYSSRTPNDQVPYAEGNRDRTPYTSYIRERTDLGDGLRRSHSTRDTTKLGPEDAASQNRARSTSPLRRQRASESHAQASSKKNGFDLNYSSSEASGNSTPNADDLNRSDPSDRPGTAPNTAPPFDRPKKIPTPPSSRFNGTRSGPSSPPPMPPMPSMNGAADGAQSEGELPGMQQKANSNMYAPYSFFSSNRSSKSTKLRVSDSPSTARARHAWLNAGHWAIPSSVNPFLRIESSKQTQYVTAADELFKNATEEEQRAYIRFQAELQKSVGYIPDNFDMEVFLNLASTARQGTPCGNPLVEKLIHQVLSEFPTVGYPSNIHADENVCDNSFSFSHDANKSTSTNAKSRSEENVNMQFSSEPVTAFGEYDFAPPPPTGRKGSPTRRTTRTPKEQPRAATLDVPTSPPATEYSQRPWGSDGLAKDIPPTGATAAGVSQHHWETKPFNFPPQFPQQSGGSITGGAAAQPRKQSQNRRTSKAVNRDATPAKSTQHPHLVDEDDTVEVQGMDGAPEHGAPVMDEPEPMDIDNTPPAQNGAGAQQSQNEARLYNVPRSRRQEQEQKQHAQRHRKTSNASRKPVPASAHASSSLKTNLDDLRNVEPISKSADAAAGPYNFGDLSASLPIQSQAASKIMKANKLSMPPVPKAPAEPTKLTKSSWPMYVQSFGAYVTAFHDFNKAMIEHFAAREQLNDLNFKDATRWLEAAGDTSGILGVKTGFGTYLAMVEEDEQVREHWNVGSDMHVLAMRAFGKVRERVRKLVEGGGLADN